MTTQHNTLTQARPATRWLRPALRALGVAAGLAFLAGSAPAAFGDDQPTYVAARSVRVTYYLPTGNASASGRMPFVGSAACSWEMPFGTLVIFPDGRINVCIDRGQLGSDGWVDVYAPDNDFGMVVERAYGGRTTVRLILPPGGKLETATPKPGTPTATVTPGGAPTATPRPGR